MNDEKIQLDGFNSLLAFANNQNKEVDKIEIDKLKHFPKHKFKLYSGERLEDMVQSVKEYGVLLPIIVWENNGEFIIL